MSGDRLNDVARMEEADTPARTKRQKLEKAKDEAQQLERDFWTEPLSSPKVDLHAGKVLAGSERLVAI